MKTIKYIFYTLLITILFSCTDNGINQDCFTCENTQTTYCIDQGDDFYLEIPINGSPTTVPLNGAFWSDVLANIQSECTNGPQLDCFTCNDTQTTYCYLPGNDFYTQNNTQVELNGQTWAVIRAELEANCVDDPNQDCYTCTTESTTYCFVEGDDFYTTTVNGNTTETELNSQTWAEIKEELIANCPTGQTTSIIGTWILSDFHGTTEATTTVNGQSTTTNSTQVGSQYNLTLIFTENPNEYETFGSYLNTITTTFQGTEVEQDVLVQPVGDGTGTWTLVGNILTVTPNDVNADVNEVTILELSATTFRYRTNLDVTNVDNSTGTTITTHSVAETFQTFTRQ